MDCVDIHCKRVSCYLTKQTGNILYNISKNQLVQWSTFFWSRIYREFAYFLTDIFGRGFSDYKSYVKFRILFLNNALTKLRYIVFDWLLC